MEQRAFLLTLDKPLEGAIAGADHRSADTLYSLDACGAGFQIRGNHIRGNRRYGCLLRAGGGVWGGAMLNNEIVIQGDMVPLLEELGIRSTDIGDGLVRADSVETASALIYRAVHAGVAIFNSDTVEDVMYKRERVAGVVINWTPVLIQGLHVDPLMVTAKAVLDGTGHDAQLTAKVAKKAGIRLDTPTGGIVGEKAMWAEVGEQATVENTREVYPGLFVSGMAANGVFGSARMGPIFGGMVRSGQRAADLIERAIG